jgi:hypothetical protein
MSMVSLRGLGTATVPETRDKANKAADEEKERIAMAVSLTSVDIRS